MMAGTVRVSPELGTYLSDHPLGLNEREIAEHAELVSSLFGIPYDIAIGRSHQILFERGLAGAVHQLAKKQLEVSGIPSEPRVMVIGNGDQPNIEYTTWAIGSPYRNPLTKSLVSGGEPAKYGLATAPKPALPYWFHIPKETLATRGYAAYDEPGEPFHGFVDAVNLQEEKEEIQKEYENARRKRKEPATMLIGPNGEEIAPEYYGGPGYLDRFTRDYWTITRMPLRNPRSEGMGQSYVVLAGCHDLGTLHAVNELFDDKMLKELDRLRGHPRFQIVGYGDKNGDREIYDAVVF